MASLFNLIAVAAGAGLAWLLGGILTVMAGWQEQPWNAPILIFAAVYIPLHVAQAWLSSVLVLSGGGAWSASPVRWIVGKLAAVALVIVPLTLIDWASRAIWGAPLWMVALGLAVQPSLLLELFVPGFGSFDPHETSIQTVQVVIHPAIRLAGLLFLFRFTHRLMAWQRSLIAYAAQPFRRLWQSVKTGVGGSTSFDGLLDEWLMPWKPGQVMLGASLYEPGRKLWKTDDRHLLTVATTRSGKGRSCIIPNLLIWPGSVLVIDPKGQNAAVTALTRKRMGQAVHIFDPFGELQKQRLDPAIYRPQRFNPLVEIDLTAPNVVEQVGRLADALIMFSPQCNPFFDNAAAKLLKGIIAHVLVWKHLNAEDRHLGTVRDYVAEINGRNLADLGIYDNSVGLAGLVAVAKSELDRSSATARGDILTTLGVHTDWLDSHVMRDALRVSDFSLATLKQRQASCYLIIPLIEMETHARFLRLFITLALRSATGIAGKHPMLFILDEFAELGPLKVIEKAAATMAGSGVRLWPFIQNLSQLEMYGPNWETFVSAASQTQLFAMNDERTAKYFSGKLGHHISWRKVRSKEGDEWVPQGATWFRTGPELARASSRDSGRSVVIFEGGDQAIMRRTPYDKHFWPWQYEPDPWEAGRKKPWLTEAWLSVRFIRDWWDEWSGANDLRERNARLAAFRAGQLPPPLPALPAPSVAVPAAAAPPATPARSFGAPFIVTPKPTPLLSRAGETVPPAGVPVQAKGWAAPVANDAEPAAPKPVKRPRGRPRGTGKMTAKQSLAEADAIMKQLEQEWAAMDAAAEKNSVTVAG